MVNELIVDLVSWVRNLWGYARDPRHADPVNPLRIVFAGENLLNPAPTPGKSCIFLSDSLLFADGYVSLDRTGSRITTGEVIDPAGASVTPVTHTGVEPVALPCDLPAVGGVNVTPSFRFTALESIRQISSYARDQRSKTPRVLYRYTKSGTARPLSLPQSFGGGNLRIRVGQKRGDHVFPDYSSDDSDVVPGRKRKINGSDKGKRAKRLEFTYPDSNELFTDVERELGLGEQAPVYSSYGWCRPPEGHPDLAGWLDNHPLDASLSQQERKLREDSANALEFRQALISTAPTVVCGVCSCFGCESNCRSVPIQNLPGLQSLRKDIPPTDNVPRSGHTSYEHLGVEYLLQPDAIKDVNGVSFVTVCVPCLNSLNRGQIPKPSLAAIDPGFIPSHLPKLTIMESLIISPSRLICHVMTLTPGRRYESHPERTEDSDGHKVDWTTASTGHTVAFRNPGPDAFLQTFPMHPDDLPAIIKVW